ncbi:type II toxin-antitoxin system RelE/ParE family toxin [Sphingopyxis sp. MWB1]|uniref:type II toxin-antitoxin system RelE/ParE family toxin n=1 Tax=Sphingopyxis sp. MWB1 TaxID=1537715 RepID=UPI000519FA83|nr:type II toxin-antitoxin system RelE/ParE family toxin [Sphingopyxis sp. MWB1]
MPSVIWSEKAVADLVALNDWLTRYREPQEATKSIKAIRDQLANLSEFPAAGSPIHGGTRKLLIKNHPFVLLYEMADGRLMVIRLVHNRSDWQSLL